LNHYGIILETADARRRQAAAGTGSRRSRPPSLKHPRHFASNQKPGRKNA
jgi:hypothetical protein